jgi:hypothetical protein
VPPGFLIAVPTKFSFLEYSGPLFAIFRAILPSWLMTWLAQNWFGGLTLLTYASAYRLTTQQA